MTYRETAAAAAAVDPCRSAVPPRVPRWVCRVDLVEHSLEQRKVALDEAAAAAAHVRATVAAAAAHPAHPDCSPQRARVERAA